LPSRDMQGPPILPSVTAEYDRDIEIIDLTPVGGSRPHSAVGAAQKDWALTAVSLSQDSAAASQIATPRQGELLQNSVSASDSLSSCLSTGSLLRASERDSIARPHSQQAPRGSSTLKNVFVSTSSKVTSTSVTSSSAWSGSMPKNMTQSASAPSLFRPKPGYNTREERRDRLHMFRQRMWLQSRGKHGYVQFSNAERQELHKYFMAWSGGEDLLSLRALRLMLSSLDLAKSTKEIRRFTEDVEEEELSFEEFLVMIEFKFDQGIVQVLRNTVLGKFGDRSLDYKTVVGSRRRQFLLDATGATAGRVQTKGSRDSERNDRILNNFVAFYETQALGKGSFKRRGALTADTAAAPVGGMGTMWRVICQKNGLEPAVSADEAKQKLMQKPLSPRSVISRVVHGAMSIPKPDGVRRVGGTLIIDAPNSIESMMSPGKAW